MVKGRWKVTGWIQQWTNEYFKTIVLRMEKIKNLNFPVVRRDRPPLDLRCLDRGNMDVSVKRKIYQAFHWYPREGSWAQASASQPKMDYICDRELLFLTHLRNNVYDVSFPKQIRRDFWMDEPEIVVPKWKHARYGAKISGPSFEILILFQYRPPLKSQDYFRTFRTSTPWRKLSFYCRSPLFPSFYEKNR